jgi:hypothetical protein
MMHRECQEMSEQVLRLNSQIDVLISEKRDLEEIVD